MKVEVPDAIGTDGAGAVGYAPRRTAPIETAADGTRYVDLDPADARTLMYGWENAHGVTYTDGGRLSGGSWSGEADESDVTVEDATEKHWQSVVTAVGEGVYDDVLEELAAADHRESVQNAISERRAELV